MNKYNKVECGEFFFGFGGEKQFMLYNNILLSCSYQIIFKLSRLSDAVLLLSGLPLLSL